MDRHRSTRRARAGRAGGLALTGLAALALALGACDGAGPNPPSATTLSAQVLGIKSLGFTWADVAGETEYRLVADADGSGAFGTVASLPVDATQAAVDVFVPEAFGTSYAVDACNAAGCARSDVVTPGGAVVGAVGYLKETFVEPLDHFGSSVALSADGGTLAVGAPGENGGSQGVLGNPGDGSAVDAGAVFVYVRDGVGGWVFQGYVKATNTGPGDAFGVALALSADGDTLAVGARGEDSGATGVGGAQGDESASFSGAVYVYTRDDAGGWAPQAYIKATNTGTDDAFGSELALSADGNTLAVGAGGEDSDATGVDGDQGDASAPSSGAVYVYTRDGDGTWSHQSYVKATNTGAGDAFGASVALSADGSTLAVGAPDEDGDSAGVGEPSDGFVGTSGAVYVYAREAGGAWTLQAYVKATNPGSGDRFGSRVALSADGNVLAAAAPFEDGGTTGIGGNQADDGASNSGAVYLYVRDGTGVWTPAAYVKASNAEANDRFGWGLARAGDGRSLAVGAYGESSDARGVGGDQNDNTVMESGAVYLY